VGYKLLNNDLWLKLISRILIIGDPNTLKTTSIIKTFDKPIGIINYPGEKGSGVIPANDPQIKALVWEEEEDKLAGMSVTQMISAVEHATWDFLAGKHGEIKTFAGDGLHKLASLYWNREYQRLCTVYADQIAMNKVDKDGVPFVEKIKLTAYGNENYGACREILKYISLVEQSPIETIVFTCREGREPDQVGSRNTHIFPDLPGKLATKMVGEFAVCLYSEVSLPDPKGQITGTWQIRKAGQVWGVGVKVPYDIATKLPERVPQDWQKLRALLRGEKGEK